MSYFIFGSFKLEHDKMLLQQMKSRLMEKKIYLWLNEEITFYKEIQRMFEEQTSEGNIRFALTSENQPCNSSDLLFPFDKYDSDTLFADESRAFYKQCCRENLELLIDCLKMIIYLLHIKELEMFVVEGYDNVFHKKVCGIEELKQDMLCQIEENMSVDSCIYCIKADII